MKSHHHFDLHDLCPADSKQSPFVSMSRSRTLSQLSTQEVAPPMKREALCHKPVGKPDKGGGTAVLRPRRDARLGHPPRVTGLLHHFSSELNRVCNPPTDLESRAKRETHHNIP